jgi:hypothetical protein
LTCIKERTPESLQLFTIENSAETTISVREIEMNLFQVQAEKDRGAACSPRTWLVIAGSLFEAMSFIPEEFSVKGVKVRVGIVEGPGRLIGWTGAPTMH